jgi:predicted PurR-regulated permease PerM
VVGILGGITAIVPRIGALIPIGLAAITLNVIEAPIRSYLIAIGLWLLIQAIEFFFLLPRLIGKPLGLRELPVLAALLLGSLAFGPIGLLLAIPALAIGLVFWRHFRKPRTP